MNSSIISVSDILNNAANLISAGFSAGYNFDDINSAEYFDELIESATQPSPIFSGIMIMQKSGADFTVIDGIQRLTTISLLLCALCESYKGTSKNNEDARSKIYTRFLLNGKEPKLKLLNKEHEIYRKIILSLALTDSEKESNLYCAYQGFLEKIKSHKISGTKLFKLAAKIQFMVIVTDQAEISARELYQSLNVNKDRSQVNLISDYFSQKDSKAGIIWRKTTDVYKDKGEENLLEDFVRDFLVIQNDGKIPNVNALYTNFKSYFVKMSKYQDMVTIAENIRQYSQYYLKIVNAQFDDEKICEQIKILNENNGKDAYPYLMEVLDDLENGHIDIDVFLDILKMINSFVIQRQDDPLSNVTIDFASLSKELNKMLVLDDYVPKIVDENKLTINDINSLSTFEV